MDIYYGDNLPDLEVVSYKYLHELEKREFIKETRNSQKMGFLGFSTYKIVKQKNGRKLICKIHKIKFNEKDGRDSIITNLDSLKISAKFLQSKNTDVDSFIKDVQNHFKLYLDKEFLKELNFKNECIVKVFFTISATGMIIYPTTNITNKKLKVELERVLTLLPELKPAIKNEKVVAVEYCVPINLCEVNLTQ